MGAKVSKYLSNVIYLAKFLVLGLPIVLSLAQHQIPMQHARIYRACIWLPSGIYSLLFSSILQHYHVQERLS